MVGVEVARVRAEEWPQLRELRLRALADAVGMAAVVAEPVPGRMQLVGCGSTPGTGAAASPGR